MILKTIYFDHLLPQLFSFCFLDGIINDMQQTKLAIIRASAYPISIVIVGVGSADFSAMNELDSDDRLLSATEGGGGSGSSGVVGKRTLGMVSGSGRTVKAVRDIVQFVPLNKFLARTGPYIRSQAELAREVLAEIPDQMTGIFIKHLKNTQYQ